MSETKWRLMNAAADSMTPRGKSLSGAGARAIKPIYTREAAGFTNVKMRFPSSSAQVGHCAHGCHKCYS
ncbi:hypothetical protein AGIG_G14180 [Arapaima gigas]